MSSASGSAAVPTGSGRIRGLSDLSWADYRAALLATKDEIARDDVPSMAAGVAFRIFLALFPSLLATAAIVGLVMDPANLDGYVDRLSGVVPPEALGIVRRVLTNVTETSSGAARGFAVTGVLGGVWAANSAATGVIRALNRAYEIEESRNPVRQRLIALAITAALVVAIAVIVTLLVAGPQVQAALLPSELQGTAANVAFGVGQGVAVLASLIVLFAFIYWVGPNRERPRWQWISPGAVVGVLGWLVVSLGFTFYVQNFASYDNPTYGGIGGVIVLLVWLQLSMTLLLVGAELNAEIERIRTQHEAVYAGAGMGLLGDEPAAVRYSAALLSPPAPQPAGGRSAAGAKPLPSDAMASDDPVPPAPGRSRAASGALLAAGVAVGAALMAALGAVRNRS